MTNSIPEIEDATCLLIFGYNGADSHPLVAKRIVKAKEKGAKTLQAIVADATDLLPVGGAPAPEATKAQEEKERQALVDKMTAYANEGRGK